MKTNLTYSNMPVDWTELFHISTRFWWTEKINWYSVSLPIDSPVRLSRRSIEVSQNRSDCRILSLSLSRHSNVSSLKTVPEKITHLVHTIKTATDRHGRSLSVAFFALPSKVDYPDYYDIIQRPIDLKRIESRQYTSIEDLSNDLQLMFDNACLYNEPGSTIYRVKDDTEQGYEQHLLFLNRLGCIDSSTSPDE